MDFAGRNFACAESRAHSPALEALSPACPWPLVPRGTRRGRLVTARLGWPGGEHGHPETVTQQKSAVPDKEGEADSAPRTCCAKRKGTRKKKKTTHEVAISA